MYVTRPLSHYLKDPQSLAIPPDGPNSGYLIIQDEESETKSCFGLCKNRALMNLPFPQNKELTVSYVETSGETTQVSINPVYLIPVLNQPMSSNRYYAINRHGKHKGEAFTCVHLWDEDMSTCCLCHCVIDLKPRQLDPSNIYQQIEICPYETLCTSRGCFFAKSVEPDGFPPYFFRRKGWSIYTKTPKHFKLDEALGLNSNLRSRLPEFDFPLSCKRSEAVTVGKWYCPFMFIKEGKLKDQVKRSVYYEMTLEQRWEQIFTRKNENQGNSVLIDVPVENEEAYVEGNKAVWNENNVVDGVMWYKSFHNGAETSIGLRTEIVERMIWEQKRVGWQGAGENRQVKINRVEEFRENRGWKEFGCYALVENFVLKRMDGSLVMTYSFLHAQQLKCKWE